MDGGLDLNDNPLTVSASVQASKDSGKPMQITATGMPFNQKSPTDLSISGLVVGQIRLRNGKGSFDVSLLTDAMNAFGGSAHADAAHTMILSGVFLLDGTTPESHGWSVTFGSGTPSPNLSSAVPEPSSLVLLALGASCALCAGTLSRRSRKSGRRGEQRLGRTPASNS
jgi:hypothetical protein